MGKIVSRVLLASANLGRSIVVARKGPSKSNKNLTGGDPGRYFAVETARGYIVINRE